MAWPRAPAVRRPVLRCWSLPVTHGTEEGALRGRCGGRKMVRWFDFAVGLLVVAGHGAPFGSAMADTWLGRQGRGMRRYNLARAGRRTRGAGVLVRRRWRVVKAAAVEA
jgi:hypothetical protein